jgi:homoserine kinase type II
MRIPLLMWGVKAKKLDSGSRNRSRRVLGEPHPMAVFTPLSLEDAARICAAHHLQRPTGVVPIPAGSVNSNYFIDHEGGRVFARIYEEQDLDGVSYEWALLDHLGSQGIPVARRVAGPAPGVVRVGGKPVGVFEQVGGVETCQAGVTIARAQAVGALLGRAHDRTRSFGVRRAGRFTLDGIRERIETIRQHRRSDLEPTLARLSTSLDEVAAQTPSAGRIGVIHGDLFRDNIRWDRDTIVAVLDWESASDGFLAYDVMVTALAWCYGDDLDWSLVGALIRGYQAQATFDDADFLQMHVFARTAAVRFVTTRLTDFHLREGIGERVHKDYRRFLARLDAVEQHTPPSFAEALRTASAQPF